MVGLRYERLTGILTVKAPETKELVRELRKRLELTQEQCAARIGVTFSTLNRWENGHAKPSPLALKSIQHEIKQLGEQGKDLLQSYFSDKERTQ